jgi:pyruvate formate lyase activating enzyme
MIIQDYGKVGIMKGRVHSYESFGTVDGPGIRYVIFLQGCPLRCQYCHNPDTWSLFGGKITETDEIVEEVLKYRNYFGPSGGVTVSGGEPLVQLEFVRELFTKLKQYKIHTCIDTSGIMFKQERRAEFDALMAVTDLVILDIKQINPQRHQVLTGSSNSNVLAFAQYLKEIKQPVWIRHVLVKGLNDDPEDLLALSEYLSTLDNVVKVEVLPYHNLAVDKYRQMGLTYQLSEANVPEFEVVKATSELLKKRRD